MLPEQYMGVSITRIWHQERWYFSIIDVIRSLVTDEEPHRYWAKVKKKLKREGASATLAQCQQFSDETIDVTLHGTVYGDMETLLRIIQSIPSPKAEPFKRWLAGLGADAIDDLTEDQKRLGHRPRQIKTHRGLHAEIHRRGVRRPKDHAEFDTRGHKKLYYGETPRETEDKRGIPAGEGPKWMGSEEMADTIFRDAQSHAYITRLNIQGKEPIMEAHELVSQEVREFIIRLGNIPPEQLPKADKSIDQAAKDEQRRRTKGMDLFPELDAPPENG